MKNIIPLLLLVFALNTFSQESFEPEIDLQFASAAPNNEIEAFAPNRKLLNTELWKRVTVNRFECGFLRLAVELSNYEYVLIEMDGNKRVLIKSQQYSAISKAIVKLTLNSTPNLSGFTTSKSI